MSFSSCPLSTQAYEVRKPVIAACNGHAIGVGLGIAVQCDMRIFAEEGRYGFLQSRRGVIADFAIHHLLPRMVGLESALELILTGQRLTGAEAREKGLAGRVVPAREVLPTALTMARDIAANCSPLVVGMAKRMIWQGMDQSLADMERLETRLLHYSMGRPDAIEGGLAFFEKRAPEWKSSVSKDWPEWF
jgi:enoyl-CoA hydratase/carnithine racemase